MNNIYIYIKYTYTPSATLAFVFYEHTLNTLEHTEHALPCAIVINHLYDLYLVVHP